MSSNTQKYHETRIYNEWLEFCKSFYRLSTACFFFDNEETQRARIKRALADYRFFVKTYFEKFADAECADSQESSSQKNASVIRIFGDCWSPTWTRKNLSI